MANSIYAEIKKRIELSNQFLYQKMGFLLSGHKEQMGLSDDFFDTCKSQIGKSKRYLTKDMSGGRYVDEWKLVIPENIYILFEGVNRCLKY